ncbi:MAG: potassium-transporting ATPase subunit KdpA [Candidatus Moduliflexus flocculans]|nr:potassium-transporting ATPase subunit KdpA [Candidatus Moduliflexus flocculans]
MLVFVVLAVFLTGLMVGRTPEYLGKKIEAYRRQGLPCWPCSSRSSVSSASPPGPP